jgi:homoserine dehydrogenase
MRILFIGFGNVAKETARILLEKELYPRLELDPTIVGVFTQRHGGVENTDGIDIKSLLNNLKERNSLVLENSKLSSLSSLEAAQKLDYDVLVELSALSISGHGEPASSYIRAALERGKSVVSANKGPVAFHYHELKKLADENGAKYMFESAVMDGAPVFNLVQRCMKGCTISGFSGILNGTTNYILSFMENGGTFEEGVKQAQEAGIAEADPTMDTDGWDPAAKTAAFANVLMDADITPFDVDRSGISQITPEMCQGALKRGNRLKLMCRAEKKEGKISASVKVEEVSKDDVMALISHFGAAIRIESDLMHPNTLIQDCPDLLDTAYGVIEGLIALSEQ